MFKRIMINLLYKLYLNFIGAIYVVKEQIIDRHRAPAIPLSQQGKTIVITGGSRGIGLEAVKKLLRLKCRVIIGCRSVEQAKSALASDQDSAALTTVLPLDLMQLDSVRQFGQQIKDLNIPIHALVNNAGIMFGNRKETTDGFESQLATNYLGHFLLSHLLLPQLELGGSTEFPSRIVNVSSSGHYLGSWLDLQDLNLTNLYTPEQAYGNSKVAQVMFSQYLDSKLSSRHPRTRIFAIHPGIVFTDLYTNVGWVQIFQCVAWLLMKTPAQGGDTIVHAALAPELDQAQASGLYFENSRLRRISSFAASLDNQAKLWDKTCQMLNIENFGNSNLS